MKHLSILFFIALLFSSCLPKPQNKHLNYQNIVILSDMSSRIRNPRFPQKDVAEIEKITQFFKNECVKPGKKIGDRSEISFSALSKNATIRIDLGGMKNSFDKQSFINSTGKYVNNGLDKKIFNFNDSVEHYYKTVVDPGLDLISLLMEKINSGNLILQDKIITIGLDTTYIHYENNIYIFTDGYLEYSLAEKKLNPQYYFGEPEIKKVRQYCQKNHLDIASALKQDPKLGLPPSKSSFNKLINLHILETIERDKNTEFGTFSHPVGLRDNEILEAVWKKWAKDSGFKSIEWKKY